jgi:hypothetical protein
MVSWEPLPFVKAEPPFLCIVMEQHSFEMEGLIL